MKENFEGDITFETHMLPFQYRYTQKMKLMENGNFYLFDSKWKTKTANYRLFAAHGNGKLRFVFLGQQTINGN